MQNDSSQLIGIEREELFQNISNLSIREGDLLENIFDISRSGSKNNDPIISRINQRLSSGKNITLKSYQKDLKSDIA